MPHYPNSGHTRPRVMLPIAVQRSSSGEPLVVGSRQVVVASVSAFEPRDGDQRDAEVIGDDGEG